MTNKQTIDSIKYVISATDMKGNRVFYAIEYSGGGYAYWTSTFSLAKQWDKLSNDLTISREYYLSKDVSDICILEVTTVFKKIETTDVVNEIKKVAQEKIDAIKREADEAIAKVTVNEVSTNKHDWHFDKTDTRTGEYWFKCSKCSATDWIASYGTEDQLAATPCAGS